MKKKLLYFFIFFIVIIICILCFNFFRKNNKKNNISKVNNQFVINNIHYYSTANAISNTTSYQNPEWNLKVYQYTDIAIYLNRLEKPSEDNYISNLEISNFEFAKDTEEIYYINPRIIGKSTLDLDSKIENSLEYNVINTENSNNEQDYNIPIFFQDCSNPITLRFVNFLSNNYKVSNDKDLIYNGILIKELGLDLKDLDSKFSFDLNITTKSGEKRTKKIEVEIPFQNEKRSILDGDIDLNVKYDIKF